jgi:hypothetical protein
VRVGVDESRRHNQSVRIDLTSTLTDVGSHGDDHLILHRDVAALRRSPRAVVHDAVSDDQIGTQEGDTFI